MGKTFAEGMCAVACLAALSATASERIALTDGWKFSREEHPGQMRYLMYDKVADWLDFMGRDLMELPGPCRTPDGEPSLWQKFYEPGFKDTAWRVVSVPHD